MTDPLRIAKLMDAMASDADYTDGWQEAAGDLRQAAQIIREQHAALEPFAEQAYTFDSEGGEEFVPDDFEPAIVGHTIGDLRRARSLVRRADLEA